MQEDVTRSNHLEEVLMNSRRTNFVPTGVGLLAGTFLLLSLASPSIADKSVQSLQRIAIKPLGTPRLRDVGNVNLDREKSSTKDPRLATSYGSMPIVFEANFGQADGAVKFLSRNRGYTLFLTSTEAALLLSEKPGINGQGTDATTTSWPGTIKELIAPFVQDPKSEVTKRLSAPDNRGSIRDVVRLKLVGANADAKVVGIDPLPGKSNYFVGSDPRKWHTDIPQYAKVRYEDVYPGIDLVYYGNQGRVEHDFIVAPGANPNSIRLALDGALATSSSSASKPAKASSLLSIDPSGDLAIFTRNGQVRLRKPVVYQPRPSHALPAAAYGFGVGLQLSPGAANRKPVGCHFLLSRNNEVTFNLDPYDKSLPLIIDPVLVYTKLIGGSRMDEGSAIAADGLGNAYLAGNTWSYDYPVVGAFQDHLTGSCDIAITKLNADGTAVLYSTYLGGSGLSSVDGIALDQAGEIYIRGRVWYGDFPTINAFQPTSAGDVDTVVAKLSPEGNSLVFSTFLGGSGSEYPSGMSGAIAVDSSGNAYVTGMTYSGDFPTTPNAYQGTYPGQPSGFVAKFDSGGSLRYSTYLGSPDGYTEAWGIAVDNTGHAFVTGGTVARDFVLSPGSYQESGRGGFDAFLVKLAPEALGNASLVWSTLLGGSSDDTGTGVAVDGDGNAYVTGSTQSPDFPITAGAFQRSFGGGPASYEGSCSNVWHSWCGDAFVAKVSPNGDQLLYSTFLGGSGSDSALGIGIDSYRNVYVGGLVRSTDFPTKDPVAAFGGIAGLYGDGFIAKLNPSASGADSLLFSTYLPGSEIVSGLSVDASMNVYAIGWEGYRDIYAAKLDLSGYMGDSTPPVITHHIEGSLGNEEWYRSEVLITWTANDPESPISAQSGCEPENVTADTIGKPLTCSATSAGGTASNSVTIKRDTAGPTVQGTPDRVEDSHGWYNHLVAVTWSGSDAFSGLAGCDPVSQYDGPDSTAASVSGYCTDRAGNVGSVSFGFKFDKTPPIITITAPVANYDLILNEQVAARYACSDSLSGVDSLTGSVNNGSSVNTSAVGVFAFAVDCTDYAGNTATLSHTYRVITVADGIGQIIDVVKAMNLGQGITNSLDAKLSNAMEAMQALNAGQRQDAINKLNAVINQTEAQRGKLLTSSQADLIIAQVRRVLSLI